MIFIADSGSTKCDWITYQDGEEIIFSTMGFNPFFHETKDVLDALQSSKMEGFKDQIDTVFFYGAGCATKEYQQKMKLMLEAYFVDTEVHVDHDLTAAAIATCGDDPGIAAILGTGSNICYFDGNRVVRGENVFGLGFILGDEASGSYFGKRLIRDYYYGWLPEDVADALEHYTNMSRMELNKSVYDSNKANVYLASFMKILGQMSDHEYVHRIMTEGFTVFVNTHVKRIPKYKEVPIHFIGSIGYYFKDELSTVLTTHNLQLGEIIRKPIYNLAKYHLAYQ